jgi:hypothetical protein
MIATAGTANVDWELRIDLAAEPQSLVSGGTTP